MKKKLLTAILSVSIAMGVLPVYANTENEQSYSEQYMILKGLDMLPSDWINNFDSEAYVTREDFSLMLADILFPDMAESQNEKIDLLIGAGILAEADDLYLSDYVTYAQAVKMAAVAAGYGILSENNGGWPNGYLNSASSAGITKGIYGSSYEAITAGNIVKLLYNMLMAEAMENVSYSTEIKYQPGGRDVLEKYRDILYMKGQMTANGVTAIDNSGYYNPTEIIVNDESFDVSGNQYSDLLGYNVTVFYKESDSRDKEVLFVSADYNKTETLTISSEYIDEVSEKVDELRYFESEDAAKTKKLKLSPAMKVIYNEKAVETFTNDDFIFDCGEITFIDNDRDGVYDIAKITEYETVIADKIDRTNKVIYNRFTHDGATPVFYLDEDVDGCDVLITKNGSEYDITDISAGSVLNVAMSKSTTNNIVRILYNDKKIEEQLSGVNHEEKEIKIGDVLYKISESYYKANNNGEVWGAELEVSGTYVFLLDSFGRIAAAKRITSDDEYYAYLFSSYYNDTGEDTYELKFLKEDGKWYRKTLAKKVRLNGESVDARIGWEQFQSVSGVIKQLVKIKENAEGDIREIKTAEETSEADETKFIKGSQRRNKYFASNRSMQGEVFFYGDTVYFSIPSPSAADAVKNDEAYYSVISLSEDWYDYIPYDMDEYYCAKAVTVLSEASGFEGSNFLVQEVKTVINSDEMPVTQLVGSYGAFDSVSIMAVDDQVLKDIQVGDFITLYLNSEGAITGYKPKYLVSQGNNYSDEYYQANWGSASQWDTGRIDSIDFEKGFMKVSVAEGKSYAIRIPGGARLFDVQKKEFKSTDFSELKAGDFIVFHMYYYNIGSVIAYRF